MGSDWHTAARRRCGCLFASEASICCFQAGLPRRAEFLTAFLRAKRVLLVLDGRAAAHRGFNCLFASEASFCCFLIGVPRPTEFVTVFVRAKRASVASVRAYRGPPSFNCLLRAKRASVACGCGRCSSLSF